MGAHLQAALRAGLTEREFWALTPHRLSLRLDAWMQSQLHVGWWVARFAVEREQRLLAPQTYVDQLLRAGDPEVAEAEASAMFERMAADWGLEVEAVD